jgi:ornithine carbamoyltransferase
MDLPLITAAASGRHPSHLLTELLALNEEMAGQLRMERLCETGTAGFLSKMIAQHERAAALLRIELALPTPAEPGIAPD